MGSSKKQHSNWQTIARTPVKLAFPCNSHWGKQRPILKTMTFRLRVKTKMTLTRATPKGRRESRTTTKTWKIASTLTTQAPVKDRVCWQTRLTKQAKDPPTNVNYYKNQVSARLKLVPIHYVSASSRATRVKSVPSKSTGRSPVVNISNDRIQLLWRVQRLSRLSQRLTLERLSLPFKIKILGRSRLILTIILWLSRSSNCQFSKRVVPPSQQWSPRTKKSSKMVDTRAFRIKLTNFMQIKPQILKHQKIMMKIYSCYKKKMKRKFKIKSTSNKTVNRETKKTWAKDSSHKDLPKHKTQFSAFAKKIVKN